MKTFVLLLLVALLVTGTVVLVPVLVPQQSGPEPKRFSSYQELRDFVQEQRELASYGPYYGPRMAVITGMPTTATVDRARIPDFSLTNIQVQGVDEADIVKTDGEYIYVVSRQSIKIIDAYPTETAEVVSQISLPGSPREIFVIGNRLAVFGDAWQTQQKAFVRIYDISDRQQPTLKRDIAVDGSYFDSRAIGEWIYVVINTPVGRDVVLPNITTDGKTTAIAAEQVQYFDLFDHSYRFTTILAVDVSTEAEPERQVWLMGQSQYMYVSQANIYIIYEKRLSPANYTRKVIDAVLPVLPSDVVQQVERVRKTELSPVEEFQQIGRIISNYTDSLSQEAVFEFQQQLEKAVRAVSLEIEKTIVHKISIQNGDITYMGGAEVPGYILNQFSMDEFEGNFRIATTTGRTTGQMTNNIYVLDPTLNIIGALEGLAPGESIFAARFIGDRAYLVTFRRIDPLFVIDLSSPTSPKVLGKLKIPGFSNYLHPYDEAPIIGVGMDVDERTGRVLGVKLALFDVSDVANPRELAKYVAPAGSNSEVLRDHKAFLFNKDKNLLVIPIDIWSRPIGWESLPPLHAAYVFDISLDGFQLRGQIAHDSTVRRSLYIGDVLWTVSSGTAKANSLVDLAEIKTLSI